MWLQKLDVEEELDRLESHVAEARRVLKLKEAVGRRLDFLLQEFNREANTLGSKSVDCAQFRRGGGTEGADRPGPRADPEHRVTVSASSPHRRRTVATGKCAEPSTSSRRLRAPANPASSTPCWRAIRTSACRSRSPRASRGRASAMPSTTTSSARRNSRPWSRPAISSSTRCVHGDWKGTARQSVEPQLASGKDVLLEIDWQGARQVRSKVPDAVSVFILPPSRAGAGAAHAQPRPGQRGSDRPAPGRRARGDVALHRVRLRHRQRALRRPPSTRCARSSPPAACAARPRWRGIRG